VPLLIVLPHDVIHHVDAHELVLGTDS
jgi:hypothetical protein